MHRIKLAAAAALLAGAAIAIMLTAATLAAPQPVYASAARLAPAAVMAQATPTATVDAAAVPNVTTTSVAASGVNTATIVVQMDAQHTIVRSLEFTEPITGLAALVRSGLDITVAATSFGPGVCAIAGTGCPADNCFCNPNQFWNYAYWDGAAWQPYPVGVSQSVISTTGAIEGWRWGGMDGSLPAAPQAGAALSALAWLRNQQDATTGGYGDSLGSAVEVMLALGANGERASDWRQRVVTDTEPSSLADYMHIRARRLSRMGVGEAAKLAVASAAAGTCEPSRTLLPSDYYSPTLGAFAPDSGFNAWSILGSIAISQSTPADAVAALAGQMLPSGGWEWQAGFGADTNTTAVAVQALLAAGYPVSSTQVISGLAFLKRGQQPDGGIVYDPAQPKFGPDANSTAYTIQALLAAGEDPAGAAWTVNGATPVSYLLSLQLPDGSFEWQKNTGANLLATTQAVAALLGRPYPIAIHELQTCPRVAP